MLHGSLTSGAFRPHPSFRSRAVLLTAVFGTLAGVAAGAAGPLPSGPAGSPPRLLRASALLAAQAASAAPGGGGASGGVDAEAAVRAALPATDLRVVMSAVDARAAGGAAARLTPFALLRSQVVAMRTPRPAAAAPALSGWAARMAAPPAPGRPGSPEAARRREELAGWEETFVQSLMHGATAVVVEEAEPSAATLGGPDLEALLKRLEDGAMVPLRGPSAALPRLAAPAAADRVVATGRLVGGEVLWRFSFDEGIQSVKLRYEDGAVVVVRPEAGTRGAWFAHPISRSLRRDSTGSRLAMEWSTMQEPRARGDLNGDGRVDGKDLVLLMEGAGRGAVDTLMDLNGDRRVDRLDVLAFDAVAGRLPPVTAPVGGAAGALPALSAPASSALALERPAGLPAKAQAAFAPLPVKPGAVKPGAVKPGGGGAAPQAMSQLAGPPVQGLTAPVGNTLSIAGGMGVLLISGSGTGTPKLLINGREVPGGFTGVDGAWQMDACVAVSGLSAVSVLGSGGTFVATWVPTQ